MNGLFGFVYTEEVISKIRFVVVSVMPLLLLSFVFPLAAMQTGLLHRGFVVFLCVLNAGGSCVDVLNLLLIAFQVPKGGLVVSNGPRSFYRGPVAVK